MYILYLSLSGGSFAGYCEQNIINKGGIEMEVKRVSIGEAKKRIKKDPELSKMLVKISTLCHYRI